MKDFIISPLFAYLKALKYPDRKESAIALILFSFMYGFFMNSNSEWSDLSRYLSMLKTAESPDKIISSFIHGNITDIYSQLSSSILALVTTNGHVLMAWFGLCYGFVVSRTLKFFEGSSNWIIHTLIFVLFIIGGLHGLAGVRHVTSSWIFFYGLNVFVLEKRSKGVLVILSSLLVHFSFIMMVAVFAGFYFLKDRTKICFIIFAVSFALTIPGMSQIIANIASSFGSAFEDRAATYSLDNTMYVDSLNESAETVVWFIKYKTDAMLCGLLIYGIVFFINRNQITINDNTRRFLNFSLLMFAFRNVVVDIPDVGVRITAFCCFLYSYVIYRILITNSKNTKVKTATIIYTISTCLSVAYAIRTTFYYVDLWEIVVTPFISIPYKVVQFLF